jgi:uncharacterized protein YqhQ
MNDEFGNARKALDENWELKSSSLDTTKLPKITDDISAPQQIAFDDEEEIITVVRGSNGDTAVKKENEDEWKMPDPVFRVSSGKTPDKSDKLASKNNLPFTEAIKLEESITAATTSVQAQPNISAEFTIRDTIEKPPAEKEEKTLSIIMLVLGIAAIIFFAVLFLAAVYFLFFYKPEI